MVAWRSVVDSVAGVYPIDPAERQKLDRQAREAKMAEVGMAAEEIKKTPRKRIFHQHDHRDDCGSALGPLGSAAWMASFGADGRLGAAMHCGFDGHQDCVPSLAEPSEEDLERIENDNLSLSFSGSSGGGDGPPRAARVPIDQFVWIFVPTEVGWKVGRVGDI